MKSSAFENFSESALEALDFARCQRGDGSFYGTGGQCRIGTRVGPREVNAIKAKADAGDKRAQQALEKLAADGDKDAQKALGSSSKAKSEPDAPAKPSGPVAGETLSVDQLKEMEPGDKIDVAYGAVYKKDEDGKFYQEKPDGEKGVLDYSPKEMAKHAKAAAEENPREVAAKPAQEAKPASKPTAKEEEGPYKKGQFAPEKDAWKDGEKLEAAAEAWRQRQGLTDETSVHDRVHAGVHAFTGRTSEDLAQMQGQKGVTTTEEILVNLVSMHAAAGGGRIDSSAGLLSEAKEMRNFFQESEGLTPTQIQRWDRDSKRAVRIFEQMSKREGFDDFISEMEAYAG
jgi:hypothetical protein